MVTALSKGRGRVLAKLAAQKAAKGEAPPFDPSTDEGEA
jgi:tRNA/rRNA methyltransferase